MFNPDKYLVSYILKLKNMLRKMLPSVFIFYDFLKQKNIEIIVKGKLNSGELLEPKIIHIETTNFCNAECIMCPNKNIKRQRGYMPWVLFKKIVDECRQFHNNRLEFILQKDGEPFLDSMLFERIEYIKKELPRSIVGFNSNAMLLDEANSRRLLNSKIDSVTFCVDGASEKTYEKIRHGLRYSIVKSNLDRFFELKKNNKIIVGMQMVVCRDNKHEIGEYERIWSKKADMVVFKSMHNFLDMGTSIRTNKNENKQLHFCVQPFLNFLVFWNGEVGLCCWDYDNMHNLGNIKADNIIELYNNEEFKKIRSAMCNKDCEEIIPCNRCSQIYGNDMDMIYRVK